MTIIVTRAGKGSALSWVEADANLTNLNNDKLEASALAPYATTASVTAGLSTKVNISDVGTSANQLIQLNGSGELPAVSGVNLMGMPAGFRNKIINGAFAINQRNYVSGAATTAAQYTLDRWKVSGTGGITFSTVNNKTTVTIPAGKTLQQVIEGLNLATGTYVLSWEGTAQGRIGGGSYGASGTVTASITGGTNTTIEFNAGTVANVQLEAGSIATPFEHRPYGLELSLCQRYYLNMGGQVLSPCGTAGAGQPVTPVWYSFPVQMLVVPTVSIPASGGINVSSATTTPNTLGVIAKIIVNSAGYGYADFTFNSADAEL